MKRFYLLALILLLPACAQVELASHVAKQIPIEDEKQDVGYFKIGSPYKIAGTRYKPVERYSGSETGIASWYGPNFHGKMTANGETFDKFEMTAAHRTLQMPSIVRVTNLENGRNVILRVNDRGPFAKNRVIDVSEKAAEALDFKHKGTTRVRVDVLPEPSRQVANIAKQGRSTQGFETALNQPTPIAQPAPKPTQLARQSLNTSQTPYTPSPKPISIASPLDPGIYVQAGAFGQRGAADTLARNLQPLGAANISPANINGSKFYRVRFGPFQNRQQASQMVANLASENISAPIIIVE